MCSVLVHAQTLEQTLSFADAAFTVGNYPLAISNYQRVIFFGNDSVLFHCYSNIANCYSATNDFVNGNKYYDLAFFLTKSDSLKNELVLKRTENFLHQKKFNEALGELFSLNNKLFGGQPKKSNVYFGIVYFGKEDYTNSEKYFELAVGNDSVKQKTIHDLFIQNKKADRINPRTAEILSIIIPGAGQIYAGDFRNGINSLLINAAFAYLFVNTAQVATLSDAVFTVAPWYFRYFQGGYKHAESIAQVRKDMKHAAIFNLLISQLAD